MEAATSSKMGFVMALNSPITMGVSVLIIPAFSLPICAKVVPKKRSFSLEDLNIGLNDVKDLGGRKVFITFPSNLPLIHQPLQQAGFKYVGQLRDYYEEVIHEMHFSHDLKTI